MAETARAAIYVRVSTREQTAENQEVELRRWAARLGLELGPVYADTASGTRNDRVALKAVLMGAHRREFGVLLVWALDRLSREGIGPMLRYLDQLHAAGVRVMSHQESWVDTSSPVWDLLVAVFAWVAQQEHQRIAERVRAGQARARVAGVHLGRPRRTVDLETVRARRAQGWSWRKIARSLKVPTGTLRRYFRAGQKSPPELWPPVAPGPPVSAPVWGRVPATGEGLPRT